MERERPSFIDVEPGVIERIIKVSLPLLRSQLPEDDYLRRLPRIITSDGLVIRNFYISRDLIREFRDRGLSAGQAAAVNNSIGFVQRLTVGEFRRMPDSEVLEIKNVRGNIRLRRLLTLRLLFGYEGEPLLASD
jgi:hypothetical protein